MFYRLLAYIKFWLTASNQHGVHSPFVYTFITKGLYTSPLCKSNASHNILLKTITYFNVNHVQLTSYNHALEKKITTHSKTVVTTTPSEEFIILNTLNQEILNQYITQNVTNTNQTILYIEGIYQNKEVQNYWKKLKNLAEVSVTIDLYYGGLVFFRKEQVKEHFKIRA